MLDTTIRAGCRLFGCQPCDSGHKGGRRTPGIGRAAPGIAGPSHRASSCPLLLLPPFRPPSPAASDHVCGNIPMLLLPRRTSRISPPEPSPGDTRCSRAHAQVSLSSPMAGCAGDDAREPTPLPIQSPVRDGRLGLCGACVTHCWAEPSTSESAFVIFCGEALTELFLRSAGYEVAVSSPIVLGAWPCRTIHN